ncbi:MAG: hypothetical protein QM765_01940 [Myxococcales bacterium]
MSAALGVSFPRDGVRALVAEDVGALLDRAAVTAGDAVAEHGPGLVVGQVRALEVRNRFHHRSGRGCRGPGEGGRLEIQHLLFGHRHVPDAMDLQLRHQRHRGPDGVFGDDGRLLELRQGRDLLGDLGRSHQLLAADVAGVALVLGMLAHGTNDHGSAL